MQAQHIAGIGRGSVTRERLMLASGVLYFILSGIAFSLVPPLPKPDAPIATIVTYLANNRMGFLVNNYLNCLNTVLFLWFLSALRTLLGRAEGGEQTVSRAAFGAGLASAVVLLVFTMISGGIVFQAAAEGDPAVIRALYDILNVGYTLAGLPIAGFLAAASVVLIGRRLSPWLGWFGALVALAQGLAAAGILIAGGPLALGSPFGFVTFLLFFLWVLLASIMLGRRRVWESVEAASTTAP